MKSLLAFLFLFLSCFPSNGQEISFEQRKSPQSKTEIIHQHVKDFPEHTQLAIAMIQEGQVEFIGIELVQDNLQQIDNSQKVFEIGSITKVFTATLLANFMLEGKVKLDDPINNYLDFPFKEAQVITFQALANHTSGLPRMPDNFGLSALLDPNNPYKNYDEAKLQNYLQKNMKVVFPPGEKSEYSNLGAALLAYTLTKIADKSYEELLDEYIFSPYKMTASSSQREILSGELVQGRNAKGELTSNWDLNVMAGAGGILSTVKDLSKFALAHFNDSNKPLELTRLKTFDQESSYNVGLGWFLIEKPSEPSIIWHNGGTGGYRSSMALDTENQTGIIILSNVSAFHEKSQQIDALCFALMQETAE